MAIIFALLRIVYLHADPAPQFLNADEGHQNSDARSWVLFGTAFYDTYNPCVIMPMFTLVKAASLKVCGVNLYGIRLPSVIAMALTSWLLCRLPLSDKPRVPALTAMFCFGASFYLYSHARIGIHEPILLMFIALAAYFLYLAIERGHWRDYALAFACALAAILTKPAGVYALGMIGGALLITRCRVDRKSLMIVLSLVVLVAAAWFVPHRAEATAFWQREVADKQTDDLFNSIANISYRVFLSISPVMGTLLVIGLVRMGFRRQPLSTTYAILLSWLISAAVVLCYSSYQPARFFLWLWPPLILIGIGQLCERPRAAATLVALIVIVNVKPYLDYLLQPTFYIWTQSHEVDRMVGDAYVAGSGFDDFSANSSTLRLLSTHHADLSTCEGYAAAFPDRQPKYLSRWSDEPFLQHCPDLRAQYHESRRVKVLNPPGSQDVWYVRTTR